ncbi:formin-like protein 4 [Bidens hawaiensis]|uniref:formin-like protein 4 n=1 Tax=Bidens hawaiensis TaxID=980011 RepID=UPI004049D759
MFFRLSYTSEVTEIKNTLQALETACKELRTRGLFVKLLEAVLKAGNRMNVGTSRGNAQAFNMNSLLKLSDVKSSDGKTTLLHFVVEEVVRLEGKRCMINNNNNNNQSFKFKDYIRLGLPAVGGVSSEFTNVKKAAAFDYDAVLRSCSGLTDRLDEIKKTIKECGGDGDERGFVREMERFVERAEREIQILRGDQERVIGLVKKINEYYQAGASKDKGRKLFQLFVIVKGFLEMVDKACIDIAVKLQKERYAGGDEAVTVGVPNRPMMKFPVLPPDFVSSSSSDSDDTEDDDEDDDDGL